MRTVALETSGISGSLAALENGEVLAFERLDPARRSAQTLAPALYNLLKTLAWNPNSLNLVAVAAGPGSFTGLRVGVTTAKVLAYAASAEILGIDTLEAVAAQAPCAGTLHALLDAHRQQLFAAQFSRDLAGNLSLVVATQVIDTEAWLAGLREGDWVSGPGLTKLAGRLPGHARVVPESAWEPRADTVGLLAWKKFQAGQRASVWQLVPQYYRPSAAEERANTRTT